MGRREQTGAEDGTPRIGPTAVVTGASSGIGRAIALALAQERYHMVLSGRSQRRLASVAADARSHGQGVISVAGDLADPETSRQIAVAANELSGRVDVLVNSAAIITADPFEHVSQTDFDRHIAVNLRAPFLLTQACLPLLRRAPSASVVNISSASAVLVRNGQSLYATTKAALEHLTRILAAELAPEGIRVNALAPGPVDTPIHATWAKDVEEAKAWLVAQVPLRRLGATAEIAAWVVWLVGQHATWATGTVFRIDGGQALASQ